MARSKLKARKTTDRTPALVITINNIQIIINIIITNILISTIKTKPVHQLLLPVLPPEEDSNNISTQRNISNLFSPPDEVILRQLNVAQGGWGVGPLVHHLEKNHLYTT